MEAFGTPSQPGRGLRTIEKLRSIALVGTYVPRRCGIATFSADLIGGLTTIAGGTRVRLVAVNDRAGGYDYPAEVRFEIEQNRLSDYQLAADFLNMSKVDLVCVQHEFGIFGGKDGAHILRLLGQLRMPVVTVLHTILKAPTPSQRQIIRDVAELSDRMVVMSEIGKRFLTDIYGVAEKAIRIIPHGIPDVPFVDPNYYKDQFGIEGRKAILTFGLLAPGKGIENVIRALPKVLANHPDTVYMVVGATHPNARRAAGEAYRLGLQSLARDLGVDGQVVFHDRYVDETELSELLGAADVYVTPYLGEEQIVSGALAYAMGAGNAVVSTPYWYASEMLAEGRGRLVPFADPDALASTIVELLGDDAERTAIRKRAYLFTRDAVWPEVARRYLRVFIEVRRERRSRPRQASLSQTVRGRTLVVPKIDLTHLRRLTDETGIFQHARYFVPHRGHGYCTDDNARALIVGALARSHVTDDPALDDLIVRYVAFLGHAFDPEARTFRNFMSFARNWTEERGSADCHGRAVWALGVAAAELEDERLRALSATMLHEALPFMEMDGGHLRPLAFALLGLDAYLGRHAGDSAAKRMRQLLTERLMGAFERDVADETWPWPEETLTYANASLPHALIASGRALERRDMMESGLRSLRWLIEIQTIDGHFVPIGNQGWFPRGGRRARFDQQPIEADVTASACVAAHEATGESEWLEEARRCFQWFLGLNDLGVTLYDPKTGGCADGLHPAGASDNQGAESTLAWLSTLIRAHELQAIETITSSMQGAENDEVRVRAANV